MHLADGFPVLDARQQRPGADHILQPRAGLFQRVANDFEAAARLRGRIAYADGLALAERRGAGDRNQVTHAYCT